MHKTFEDYLKEEDLSHDVKIFWGRTEVTAFHKAFNDQAKKMEELEKKLEFVMENATREETDGQTYARNVSFKDLYDQST